MDDPLLTRWDERLCHHLYDTLILLGAPPTVATMIRNPDVATEGDVDELRQFNIHLIDGHKDRLTGINTMTIKPRGD